MSDAEHKLKEAVELLAAEGYDEGDISDVFYGVLAAVMV